MLHAKVSTKSNLIFIPYYDEKYNYNGFSLVISNVDKQYIKFLFFKITIMIKIVIKDNQQSRNLEKLFFQYKS